MEGIQTFDNHLSPSLLAEPCPLLSSTPLKPVQGEDETDGQSFSTPSYSSSLHPVLGSQGYSKAQSHRQQIVREIYDTEHSYISQLTTVVSLFLEPIRVGSLLPQQTITAIFSNIEAILSVNQELFAFMRKRSLGEAFSDLGPFLKLYSTYAENYQNANETLQERLKQDSDFSSFVVSQESRPECCGLRLSSLLITPVQRVPRYKLLLSDLLKHTKVTHTDYKKLKAASAEVASVTSHINEHVRKHENFRKMLAIQQSLVCRTFKGKKAMERIVFLFSDILVYAKPTMMEKRDVQRSYECRCVLPLLHSKVKVLSEDERAPGINRLFKISNSDTSLIFYSLVSNEVMDWVEKIQNIIRELQETYSSLLIQQQSTHTNEQPSVQGDSSSVSEGTNTMDFNTMTKAQTRQYKPKKDSPYPLTATLFSPNPRDQEQATTLTSHGRTHTSLERVEESSGARNLNESLSRDDAPTPGSEPDIEPAQGSGNAQGNEGDITDNKETERLIQRNASERSLSTVYSMDNDYMRRLGSRCCVIL